MDRAGKAALVSTGTSALLAAGMILVAIMSGSIALLAEGIDTIADTVSSLALFIGLRLSKRHTKTFPFGLYKLENLIATAIGLLILISGYEVGREAVSRIRQNVTLLLKPGLVLVTLAVTAVITAGLAYYKGRVASMENSPGLAADSRHSLADLAAILAVILGVGLEALGLRHSDSIAALVVVIFLAWAGISVTINGVKVLLDASIEPEILQQARQIAEEHHGVKKVLKVEGRNSGPYRFLNLSLVPRALQLSQATHVAEEVEDSIRNKIPNIDRVNIEMTAERQETLRAAVPLEPDGRSISTHFGEAPSFAIIDLKVPEGEAVSDEKLANPFLQLARGKGLRVAEFLAHQGANLLLVSESLEGSGAHYALEAQGILEIVRTDARDIDQAESELSEFVRKTYH
jgi:cation diffusion facilitator family transporter